MNEESFNTPKKREKQKPIFCMSPEEKIKLRISRLRRFVVGGRTYIKLFQEGRFCETTTAKVWNNYRRMDCHTWPDTLRRGQCVEDALLLAMARLARQATADLEQLRNTAYLHARAALFDHVMSESLVTSGWGKMLTMRHAYFAVKFLAEPYCIESDQFIASTLSGGMERYGDAFLKALVEVQRNLSRRCTGIGDDCLFVLATNWTNPHCPLWLMTRHAIYRACIGLTNGLVVTEHMIHERLKKQKWVRVTSPPIADVKLNSDGEIESIEVSSRIFGLTQEKEFTTSSGLKYHLVKRPARHRLYTRASR